MDIKVIKKEEYKNNSWSGGTTSEIYIYPEDSIYSELNFKYRISSATVDIEESKFTSLNGVNRYITPLNDKLKLTHDNENYMVLEPLDVYEFDGGIETKSYGKVRDFNLMLSNGATGYLNKLNETYISINQKDANHIFIFSYDTNVKINIDNSTYKLNKMDSLYIFLKSKKNIKINVLSEDKNILISKIKA